MAVNDDLTNTDRYERKKKDWDRMIPMKSKNVGGTHEDVFSDTRIDV